MDDDLMSLRGGSQPNDDDLFGAFSDPDDLGFDSPEPPPTAPGPNDFSFDNEFSFPDFDDPTLTLPSVSQTESSLNAQSLPPSSPPKGKPKTKTPPRSSKPRSRGMTPQQRMILAVFLFLDVAMIGFLILLVIGAIQL